MKNFIQFIVSVVFLVSIIGLAFEIDQHAEAMKLEHKINTSYEIAKLYQDNGELGEAMEEYQNILLLDKSNKIALFGITELYMLEDRYYEANAFIEANKRYLNSHQEFMNLEADVLFGLNEYDQALTIYLKAEQAGYTRVESYLNIARIFTTFESYQQAEEYAKKALAVDEYAANVLLLLSEIELLLEEKDNTVMNFQH